MADREPRVIGSWMILPPPPEVCQVCARDHESEIPHDLGSFYYKMTFSADHDRLPKWSDAMAHCTPEVREQWTDALVREGVSPDDI